MCRCRHATPRSPSLAGTHTASTRATCRGSGRSPARRSLTRGGAPRAAPALVAPARWSSWLSGRSYVTPDDVKAMPRQTLRHRVMLRPEAELEGATTDGGLVGILASVQVHR